MCFGKKDHYDPSAVAARPTSGPPQQPTYAPAPTKKQQAYDAPPAPPPSHAQQSPQPLVAEMPADEVNAPAGPPPGVVAELYSPPDGPPPGRSVNGAREEEFAAPAAAPAPLRVVKKPAEQYDAPAGPPPGRAVYIAAEDYAAPSGPPPGRAVNNNAAEEYTAPSGPPPGRAVNNIAEDYAAPPGPPPSHAKSEKAGLALNNPFNTAPPDYEPPSGPPPSQRDYTLPPTSPPPEAKPLQRKQTWELAVPDDYNEPPPNIFTSWDTSPTNNATEAQAAAATDWCNQHPPSPPLHLEPASLAALEAHIIRLMPPQDFRGTLEPVTLSGDAPPTGGVWRGKTQKGAPDSCIIGFPPLYSPIAHSPLATGKAKTIYYEVKIRPDSRREETSLALGYTVLPYPYFRMPGWHRGSLAVHGDDGHKYINDMWGGRSFTAPIQRGQTVGIGMRFTPIEGKIDVKVFFTRDGRADGEWDLYEETDADQELPVTGLDGFYDLSCAIGTFDLVSFDIVFEPERWMFKPEM